MADETKRVIDQTTDTSLSAGDFVIIDSQSEGTRKFDLGTELTSVKQDLEELQNDSGVTAKLKLALLQLASKVAYEDDEDGQTCYNALYDALYPNASSISCVYTQTGTVYTTDTLDSLKDDLVVTAHYSDSTTKVLKPSDYTLTGTLTAGTSTIIVHYGNLETSFTVTVTVRTLSSISAVYTQSGTVYTDDDLDSLKSDLVVTATYNDSSTEIVPSTDYELSGTLASGTSTITVTYESKTTTFTVNNVIAPLYSIPDFEEQTITINTNRYAKVKKENGVYTYKATGADVAYIYPDGTVHNSRSTNEWIVTPADKPISNQVLDLTYNNPGSSAITFAAKYSQASATGNLATAEINIAANTSGHEDFISFENAAYPERHFSGFGIQMGTNVNYEKSATFKMRLFCDGVRYL